MTAWPALRVDDWTQTRETLHMWLQSTYEAAAIHGGWDRGALEYEPVEGARPD